MNDRFNFRGYHPVIGEVMGISEIDYHKRIAYFTDGDGFNIDEVKLMECTGLKDVEGNLIYEGDIIVIPNQYPFYDENVLNYVGVVEYIYNSWQYVYHCVNPKKVGISEGINYLLNEDGIEENENSYFKVIGNIYQNPEFLR